MKHLKFTYVLVFVIASVYGQNNAAFTWPNGAKAAICLTYDDGLSSHVNIVAPMLKKYNFKATFYPTLSSSSLYNEIDKWKSLVKEGHELGNHTVYHPCQKSKEGMEWVKNHLDLDNYTLEQILEEIQLANSFLLAIDGKKSRTFAYPCAHFNAGGVSYKASVSKLFSAARGSSTEQIELLKPLDIDLYNVPSWAPNNHNGKELIAYIEKIIKNKTLSSFTFHGVNAEHMMVTKEAHETLLKYLDSHRDDIWVTTFQDATNYLKSMKQD